MGRREDFHRTLSHMNPNRLIIDFGGNPLSRLEGKSHERLLKYLGLSIEQDAPCSGGIDERILNMFCCDTRAVGRILRPESSLFQSISDSEYIDEWGIKRRWTGLYWDIVESPLRNATMDDLDVYAWPDPLSVDMAEINRFATKSKYLYEQTDYIICAEHPVYGVFELGCWMCGFDEFLYRCAAEPEFVKKFFQIILEYQKKIIDIYYSAIGKFVHYTSSGDDFATQNGPFMSPAMFTTLIAPFFTERITHTKKYTNASFLHHSCGSVYSLIEELIACGVEILNPIQPRARHMEPVKLKAAYGDKIVFHGGIDTQELLPFADKTRIEAEVGAVIKALNQDGGYIFAAAHNIQEDVPPENIVTMLEAANKFR